MSDSPSYEASRRTVIRGGAVGAGALLGALGLGAGTAVAAPAANPAAVPAALAAAAAPNEDPWYFLKLDNIAGDSTYKGLEGWIQLSSFSWGAARAMGDGSVRPPTALDTTFTAPTSKASPLLVRSMMTGETIKSGQVVAVSRQRQRSSIFLKLELSEVRMSHVKFAYADGAQPMDDCAISFQKGTFSYYPMDARGTVGEPVSVTFDFFKF